MTRGEASSPLSFYMHLKEQLAALAEEVVGQNGCQLVSFQLKGNAQQQKIVLLVDNEPGITIDECGKISRQLDAQIEAQGFFSGAYVLEVSSPGLDQPFKEVWQYKKNLNRKLAVQLLDGRDKEGKLVEVTDTYIVLEGIGKPGKIKKEDKIVQISFDQIKESKVQVSFN